MLYYAVLGIYVLVSLLLVTVILLQQGKGGDMASAFGGGSSQAVFGARSGATLLTKMTTGLAAAFILGSLVLAAWGQAGPGSVVGGVEGPAAPTLPAAATQPPPQQPAPASQAPAQTTPPPQ